MQYRELTFQKLGHCIVVRMHGSSNMNGWIDRIANELEEICDKVNWDDETRAVILSYSGNAFKLHNGLEWSMSEGVLSSITASIAKIKQPVIAAIEGDAIGFGLELALACDIRIGTEGSCFGFNQVANGLIPSAGGTQRLPRLVGFSHAMEMVLMCKTVVAQEALGIGLVNRVVPVDNLLEMATALGEEMSTRSPIAMKYVKEALHEGLDMSIDQGIRMELDLYLHLFTTQDRTEGITAFKEKRTPNFEGV